MGSEPIPKRKRVMDTLQRILGPDFKVTGNILAMIKLKGRRGTIAVSGFQYLPRVRYFDVGVTEDGEFAVACICGREYTYKTDDLSLAKIAQLRELMLGKLQEVDVINARTAELTVDFNTEFRKIAGSRAKLPHFAYHVLSS